MSKETRLEFYGGNIGKYIPLITALIFIVIAAISQAKVEGYVIAFFMAILIGVIFSKDEEKYGNAIVQGLTRPMFGVIALAILLASVGGAIVSKSGLISTLAYYIINFGFTGKLFVASSFILSCLISFSTGTSVGTYFAIGPILYPVGVMAGADPAFMIGAIVAGAAFGDNLAPISDTTIASSQTQGMDIGGVVRSRLKYSIPVALIAFCLYLIFGSGGEVAGDVSSGLSISPAPISLLMLVVPFVIIILCLLDKHLITSISYGVVTGLIIGLVTRIYQPVDILSFPAAFKAEGILVSSITGSLSTIALLLTIFPLLGIMETSGVIDDIARYFNKMAKNKKGAEVTIIGSVGILTIITGVISVAILAVGNLVNELGSKHDIHGYRRANLMDCSGVTFGFIVPWTVHAIVPAMITSNAKVAVVPGSIPFHNFYSWVMLLMLIFAVTTGYGRENRTANLNNKKDINLEKEG